MTQSNITCTSKIKPFISVCIPYPVNLKIWINIKLICPIFSVVFDHCNNFSLSNVAAKPFDTIM